MQSNKIHQTVRFTHIVRINSTLLLRARCNSVLRVFVFEFVEQLTNVETIDFIIIVPIINNIFAKKKRRARSIFQSAALRSNTTLQKRCNTGDIIIIRMRSRPKL